MSKLKTNQEYRFSVRPNETQCLHAANINNNGKEVYIAIEDLKSLRDGAIENNHTELVQLLKEAGAVDE